MCSSLIILILVCLRTSVKFCTTYKSPTVIICHPKTNTKTAGFLCQPSGCFKSTISPTPAPNPEGKKPPHKNHVAGEKLFPRVRTRSRRRRQNGPTRSQRQPAELPTQHVKTLNPHLDHAAFDAIYTTEHTARGTQYWLGGGVLAGEQEP